MRGTVVALREGDAASSASELAASVRSAIDRASVFGADIIALGPEGPAFRIDGASMEDLVELATGFANDERARWAVGIGVGELELVRDEGGFARLCIGPALSRAFALARVGSIGEVVVDVAAPEVAAGALLGIGKRVATDGAKRLRGLVLDLGEPWRHQSSQAIDRLREPRVVGRELALAAIESVERGGLALVRAAPGFGGTRFLREAAARSIASLVVAPSGIGAEPLGALRCAFDEARIAGTLKALPAREAEFGRALEARNGIDIASAGDLIVAALAHDDADHERPVLLVDDATYVDHATLAAIAHAAATPDVPFALAIRIDPKDPVPAPLASLIIEADVSLKALAPHEAATMIEDCCGGPDSLSPEVKKRWVRRGGGVPLALVEALRHGLALGELAVRDGVVVPRSKLAGRGRALSPIAWISRRLAALAVDRPASATVVSVIAIAGATLDRTALDEIAADLELPLGAELDALVDRLVREGWITREGAALSTATRSLIEAAQSRLDEGPRRRIHGAIAAVLARIGRGIDLAEAAHHAALAGDHLGAASLAKRAAERAARAGLDAAADALMAFSRAEGHDASPLQTTPSPPPATRVRPSPVASPPPPLEMDPPSTHRSPAPLHFPMPSLGAALSTTDIASLPSPGTPAMPTLITHGRSDHGFDLLEELDAGELEDAPSLDPASLEEIYQRALASLPPPSTQTQRAREGTDPHARIGEASLEADTGERPTFTESPFAFEARKALLSRDWPALDRAIVDLDGLVPLTTQLRLRALSALGQGDTFASIGFALRARESAQSEATRARASLACAVALEAAGAREDALVEAFDALGRARALEPGGAGDQACIALIERLLPHAH